MEDLIGRTCLAPSEEDGTRTRVRMVEQIRAQEDSLSNDPTMVKFRAVNDAGTVEDVVTYNQLLDKLEEEDGQDDVWKFTAIEDHEGPLTPNDERYKGSSWNVKIAWDNGEITWEPLAIIAKEDPVTCAIYGKEAGLLDLPGWRRFASLARRQKKLLRLAHQAKLRGFRNRVVFKFGIQVPQSHAQAIDIDRINGNTLWQDAEALELSQIDEYEALTDKGVGYKPGPEHKKIRVHMVHDVKVSLKRKARLVADGNLTSVPLMSIYSSVVTLRGMKTTLFLAELNQLEAWATDVGNAYLEACTDEKLFIVAGDEFGARRGPVSYTHLTLPTIYSV